MNNPSKILKTISRITKKLPENRKLNKVIKLFNKMILAFGLNPIVISEMKDGTKIKVDLSTKTERLSFYTGKYDSFFIDAIKSLLSVNDCFLDVGANIGFYTIAIGNYIREKNAHGKVISFEPFEGNYKRLSENVKLNALENFCLLNNYGLSMEKTQTVITLREDFKRGSNTGNAAIQTNEEFDKGFKLSPIKLQVLDDVWENDFAQIGTIDLIKMDIEGHEDFCLKGGQKIIKKHRPTILMEVNKLYYQARKVDLDTTFKTLIPENYNIYRPNEHKWVQIDSLDECTKMDNIFLVPIEKLVDENYQLFNK